MGDAYAIAPDFADVSIDKVGFADAVFGAPTYVAGLRAGASYLRSRLLPAIRARPGSAATQAALFSWSFVVLVLPRPVGLPLARYVCNPASR